MSTATDQPVTAQFETVCIGDLTLESGKCLKNVEIALETCGTLSPTRDNIVLICHALTGDARAVGKEEAPGWWRGLVGPGCWVDTERYFVVTTNVIGGCFGSTGPTSLNPDTGKAYAADFPRVTIRDMVKAQYRCLRQIGFSSIHAVIGGSMGGMQALEWAIMYPFFAKKNVTIAASAQLTAMAIAYNDIGRQAIQIDPNWNEGYYEPGHAPTQGLSVARMLGMVTYRTEKLFEERFGRQLQYGSDVTSPDSLFAVESYLRYQGEKLVKRFDPNAYLYLIQSMDTHDIGRNRGGIKAALNRIEADMCIVGITEDVLFPIHLQRELHEQLQHLGKRSHMVEISSVFGHDAFLVAYDQFGEDLRTFLSLS